MAFSTIAKCILIPINSIFMLIGLGFAIIGVILTFFPGVLLEQVYNVVKDDLKQYLQVGSIQLPDTPDDLTDLPFINQLGTALLVLGVFLFVVSWFCWCGATCTSCCRCLLLVFVVMLLVMMAAEILTGSMFLVTDSKLHDDLRSEIKDRISTEFNETSGDAFSSIIIFISNLFDCCGIDGVNDFGTKANHFCGGNHTEGCYTKLTEVIDDNITWAGLAFAGFLLLQLMEVIFAIAIFKSSGKVSPV